jgi:hypothetical protein
MPWTRSIVTAQFAGVISRFVDCCDVIHSTRADTTPLNDPNGGNVLLKIVA